MCVTSNKKKTTILKQSIDTINRLSNTAYSISFSQKATRNKCNNTPLLVTTIMIEDVCL